MKGPGIPSQRVPGLALYGDLGTGRLPAHGRKTRRNHQTRPTHEAWPWSRAIGRVPKMMTTPRRVRAWLGSVAMVIRPTVSTRGWCGHGTGPRGCGWRTDVMGVTGVMERLA